MFSSKKQPTVKSLIAQGTRVQGKIDFSDGLRVEGDMVGDVAADGARPSVLVVAETGSVVGSIRADQVVIAGRVVGPVHAAERLELQPSARVEGDVHYKMLQMQPGAVIAGQLRPTVVPPAAPALALAAEPSLAIEPRLEPAADSLSRPSGAATKSD